ncbi:hypothetical protein CC86DRAFT_137061 [Ophiobolus disseminans]|uniref:DUF6594 domain-containing protein n=1 Tax=Ophiobolus disseminans TaxID=1469910 RepID=A0A6A7AF21_9PLEO|nr:hypothetical protein CC86DRAFT_137061 [Ophiobolus disseminans]
MHGFKYTWSSLYAAFNETPELTKFRRYVDLWSWILNNQVSDIEKQLKECNEVTADVVGRARDNCEFVVTDYHRAYADEEHPQLKPKMEELVRLVRRYSKDLMLAQDVANLPEQDNVFARYLANYPGLLVNRLYGPTKEPADIYQEVPSHAGTCSLKSREDEDFVTNLMLKHLQATNEWRQGFIDRVLRRPVREKTALPQYFSLKTIRTIMHIIAGVYVPILFAGSLKILSSLESESTRIVVLGLLCLLLMWSLILLVPTLRRSDLFAIAAAYFAVGGVYIGAKGLDRH